MADLPLALWMFPALFALVLLGTPVAFALLVTAFCFAGVFFGWRAAPLQLFDRIQDIVTAFTLAAVPLFILMGAILEKSGLAERLFLVLRSWLGRLPGGLALATLLMGAIFAAATGIIGAVEVVIGMMAVPPMRAALYRDSLIAGTVCAGGSLGTMIPPSIVCVIYAAIGQLPVNQLFAGILVPGLLMVSLFVVSILAVAIADRSSAPAPKDSASTGFRGRLVLSALLPPVILIVAVLGSIFLGVASPTEAAAVGVLGAVLLTAASRRLTPAVIVEALAKTAGVTAMIFAIVVGGGLFAGTFYVNGGGDLVRGAIAATGLDGFGIVLTFLAIAFLAGFVLDWASVILICVPIFTPILADGGVDPLWFAVCLIIVLQTSYLTPPMAPAVFYFRTIAPPDMSMAAMWRGVVPFVLAQLATLALVLAWPGLATWLPRSLSQAG